MALRLFIANRIADGFEGTNTWADSDEMTSTGMDGQPWTSIEYDYPPKPSVTFSLQSIPAQPAPNTIAIRLLTQQSSELTGLHTAINRTYQIVYFGASNIDVIDTMDLISRELNQQTKLQVGTEHITLGPFSLSQGFKAENGTEAMFGNLEVTAYELRNETAAPKIGTVSMTFKTKE